MRMVQRRKKSPRRREQYVSAPQVVSAADPSPDQPRKKAKAESDGEAPDAEEEKPKKKRAVGFDACSISTDLTSRVFSLERRQPKPSPGSSPKLTPAKRRRSQRWDGLVVARVCHTDLGSTTDSKASGKQEEEGCQRGGAELGVRTRREKPRIEKRMSHIVVENHVRSPVLESQPNPCYHFHRRARDVPLFAIDLRTARVHGAELLSCYSISFQDQPATSYLVVGQVHRPCKNSLRKLAGRFIQKR